MEKKYNMYCTPLGCGVGGKKVELENPWPSWNHCLPPTGGLFDNQRFIPKAGGLLLPAHTFYPQALPSLTSYCGPMGCGPIQYNFVPVVRENGDS